MREIDKNSLHTAFVQVSDHCLVPTPNTNQFSGEIQSMAHRLQSLPPEYATEIVGPLRDLIRAAGIALSAVYR